MNGALYNRPCFVVDLETTNRGAHLKNPLLNCRVAKSVQLSSGQNFQSLHEPFSRCCKVELFNEALSLISSDRRHDYGNRSTFINFFCFVCVRIDYVVC